MTGFRFGMGLIFGVIAAIVVIIVVIAAVNYKTPYQKWSDCVTAQAQNGNSYPEFTCGSQPG